MAAVFVWTTQSQTALITQLPENTWVTVGLNVILTAVVVTHTGIPAATVIVITVVVQVTVTVIGITMGVIVTGVIAAAPRLEAVGIPLTMAGVAGVIRAVHLGEVAQLDGTMMPQQLRLMTILVGRWPGCKTQGQ